MDDSARGIATAALTLQSNLLNALIRKAVLTRAEALDIVDSSLRSASQPDEAADIARICLEGLREGLVELTAHSLIPDLDIYRAAKLLINQHGQDAPIRAAERADDLFEAGDPTALRSGVRSQAAIEELQRNRGPEDSMN